MTAHCTNTQRCITGLHYSSFWNLYHELLECQEENASLIFWSHNAEEFNYLSNSDEDIVTYSKLKEQLIEWKQSGIVSDAEMAKTLMLGKDTWYILNIKIECALCYPNTLLSDDGSWEAAEWTPYLFRDKYSMMQMMDFLRKQEVGVYDC